MTTAEKLQAGFLARARREKLLAVLFLVVLAAVWLFVLMAQVRTFRPELRAVRAAATDQGRWLGEKVTIQERYDEAYRQLSEIEMPTGNAAYATVDQIVRRFGAAFGRWGIDPPQPVKREQLTFHPINVSIYKGDYNQLSALFREITTALPTVNLDEVTIAVPDKNNATILDAKFKFVAIEINR